MQGWFDIETTALAWRASAVDADLRPDQCDPAGVEFDKAAAGLEGQLDTGLDDDFLAGLEVDFSTGLNQLRITLLGVLAGRDGQVVVGAYLGFPVAVSGAVFFGLEFAVAIGFDCVVTLVADADFLVVLDVFVPVTLSVQVDLLGTLAVFDAQLVVTAATE